MLVELVFVGDGDQVILYFFLTRIFTRPVGVGFEGIGVEVAQDCQASAVDLRKLVEVESRRREKVIPSQQQPG